MIKINRLDIFNNDNLLCIKGKFMCDEVILILCFYHLIKYLLVIGRAPRKKLLRERSRTKLQYKHVSCDNQVKAIFIQYDLFIKSLISDPFSSILEQET